MSRGGSQSKPRKVRMAARKLPLRVQRKIPVLRQAGMSYRQIARRLGIAEDTARRYATGIADVIYREEDLARIAQRCPTCRRKVRLPCLACRLEAGQL